MLQLANVILLIRGTQNTLKYNYTLVHVNQKIIKIQIYNEPAMLLEEKALGKKLNKLALISMVMLGP